MRRERALKRAVESYKAHQEDVMSEMKRRRDYLSDHFTGCEWTVPAEADVYDWAWILGYMAAKMGE